MPGWGPYISVAELEDVWPGCLATVERADPRCLANADRRAVMNAIRVCIDWNKLRHVEVRSQKVDPEESI